MREILFKAKRVDNGEWVEGSLLQTTAVSLKSFIVESSCYTFDKWDWNKCVQVDTDTVCQYTGLTDKNRNKIWEHDIVHLFGKDTIRNYDWKAVVEFGNPNSLYSWGYQLKPIGHFEYNEDILCWVGMEEANIYCEVIGNIFDNADLLKGE